MILSQFEQFRQEIYGLFRYRGDALLDLLDSLSGNTQAGSVAELSLNASFRRAYGSIYDGIENFFNSNTFKICRDAILSGLKNAVAIFL